MFHYLRKHIIMKMNLTIGNVQQEKVLVDAIAEIQDMINSGKFSYIAPMERILREYQDELKELRAKSKMTVYGESCFVNYGATDSSQTADDTCSADREVQ